MLPQTLISKYNIGDVLRGRSNDKYVICAVTYDKQFEDFDYIIMNIHGDKSFIYESTINRLFTVC